MQYYSNQACDDLLKSSVNPPHQFYFTTGPFILLLKVNADIFFKVVTKSRPMIQEPTVSKRVLECKNNIYDLDNQIERNRKTLVTTDNSHAEYVSSTMNQISN